jgi:hypothetical protein
VLEMMKILLLFTFLFTHPLDNGPYSEINFSEINPLICMNNKYLSPIDGIIEEITPNNNKFTLKISNDSIEIIFVDLDHIYKNIGETVKAGDEIGEDNKITAYTKFVIIQYENAEIFPQFNNNKLHFNVAGTGKPIYSMESGIVSIVNYESYRGNYIEVTNYNKGMFISQIQYWHNQAFAVRIGEIIDKNKLICYSGNTGVIYEPQLTVFFTYFLNDLRAIYIKNK